MPWRETSRMDSRAEFVALAGGEGANVASLCRRFGVSRKTGYKWLSRAAEGSGLGDRSRRPKASPARTQPALEQAVLSLRRRHPSWGGRKLRRRLLDAGAEAVPTASTITAILHRHGAIDPAAGAGHAPFIRFEHARPNALWQMDFKGHFALAGGRCHPLTVLDDHSRFSLCLAACADERTATVQGRLTAAFQVYGLPERMTMDNGSPWGDGPRGDGPAHRYTPLTVWLMRLGIRVSHSRPFHPQTNGKDERFHRTLKADLLQTRLFGSLADCQGAFDQYRQLYNLVRPHEALGMAVPASRYQPSAHLFPSRLPELVYADGDIVRTVQQEGRVHFQGRHCLVPKAFRGERIAFRSTATDGIWHVQFARHTLGQVDMRCTTNQPHTVTHVPEQV